MFELFSRVCRFVASTFSSTAATSEASSSHSPAFNVDGTPMVGAVDIHGNPYGVTSSHGNSARASWGLSASDPHDFEPHRFEPLVNIDGTPMVGMVDIRGNPYGVTDHHAVSSDASGPHDAWSSHDPWSSHDSWNSHGSWSSGGCGSDW